MKLPEFLVTTRTYCLCGQMHETITHLTDKVEMKLDREPFPRQFFEAKPLTPDVKIPASTIRLSGEYGRIEFNGVEFSENKVRCMGCGKDVLFGEKEEPNK